MNASAPALAPLGRLFWKEYRAQRAFWVALLFLGLFAQVTFRILLSNPVAASVEERAVVIWALVVLVPLLFTIGSTAILFAGEREERTCDWLLHLAAPPAWLLLAKVGFVLIASLTMAMILSMMAIALVWMLPPSTPPHQSTDVSIIIVAFACCALWGTLGSLLSRRVVTAIPAMGFWWIATCAIPITYLPTLLGYRIVDILHERSQMFLLAQVFAIVTVADVWLAWNWCRGTYWDFEIFNDLKRVVIRKSRPQRSETRHKSRLPVHVESSGLWQREWQRLVWQERHRESLHRLYLYGGCALVAMLQVLGFSYVHYGLTWFITPVIVCAPLTMGLLGFRYDGEGQPLRFLASRGISSRSVWLAKHAVWFPRAIWIPLVVLIAAVCAEFLMLPDDLTHHDFMHDKDHLLLAVYFHAARIPFEFVFHSGPVEWIFWFVVLSYGCGQLAAMSSPKAILAIVIGIALNIVASFWLLVMAWLAVPLWWSVGGLAAWLFGLTWWSAPQWLMERRLVGRPSRLLATVLLPPLILVGTVGVWRANEIVGFGPEDSPLFAALHPQEFMRRHEPTRNYQQTFTNILQNEIERQSQAPSSVILKARAKLSMIMSSSVDNESRVKSIMEVTRQELDTSPFFPWLELNYPALLPHNIWLFEAGRMRMQAGRLDEALECYCASLRLATFWAKGMGQSYRKAADHQQEQTLQQIILWANHRDQTATSLRQAIPRIRDELQRFPSWRETLVAQYRKDLGSVRDFIETGYAGTDETPIRRPDIMSPTVNLARYLPWERFRTYRLLEQQLLSNDRMLSNLMNGLNQPGVDVVRRQEQVMALMHGYDQSRIDELRNAFTTPLAFCVSSSFDQRFEFSIIQRETVIRQSLLALELLAWKLDHHSWPDALHQLITRGKPDSLPAMTATDPWCGEFFEYNGIFANKNASESFSPLLTTVGANSQREVLIDGAGGGVTTTEHGLYIGYRTWAGQQTKDGYERCRLQIEEGRLVLYIPPR